MSRSTNWRLPGMLLSRSSGQARTEDGAHGSGGTPSAQAVPELPDFDPGDIDPEELREFMEADWVEVEADPGFRERLRQQLWAMLRPSSGDDEDEQGD